MGLGWSICIAVYPLNMSTKKGCRVIAMVATCRHTLVSSELNNCEKWILHHAREDGDTVWYAWCLSGGSQICSEIKTQNRNDLDNHPTYVYHILELTVLTRPLEEGVWAVYETWCKPGFPVVRLRWNGCDSRKHVEQLLIYYQIYLILCCAAHMAFFNWNILPMCSYCRS